MKNKELEKIRKERKELNGDNKKPQKRKVEIIEYEDGSYSLVGFAYNLPLQRDEVSYAFESWLDGLLENRKELDIKLK